MRTNPESLIHPDESVEGFIAANYAAADLTNRSDLSFPDLSVPEAGYELGTTLRFIFWMHTPTNQQNVIPLMQDCDILVMEAAKDEVYKNVIERQRREREMQLSFDVLSILVTGRLDPKLANRLSRRNINLEAYTKLSDEEREEQIRQLSISSSYTEVLTHYAGQFEKIFLVDLELGDVERHAKMQTVTQQNAARFSEAIIDSDGSWIQLEERALEFLKAEAMDDEFRERLAAKQLERIVRANPDKKIAVLYGAGHQLLTRQVEAPGVRLQRQFADITVEEDRVANIGAQLQVGIENSLRAGVYDHDHLEQYLVLKLALSFDDKKMERAIGKMTPRQLSSVAAKLSKLWEEPIDYDGDYGDLDGAECMVQQRRAQTRLLLRSASIARRLSGFLRSNS